MKHGDTPLELFARCASGFERIVAAELKALGAKRMRPLKGGVSFSGGLEDAYRACLWLRAATRVQVVLARVDASSAAALYDAIGAFPWESHIAPGATFAVRAHGQNANLRNTQFTALKVKDAVCDRMREMAGTRPDVRPSDPDFALDVSVHENRATLYLNASGASLHRRGYREEGVQTDAPLKETLAAGMLLAAGWDALVGEEACAGGEAEGQTAGVEHGRPRETQPAPRVGFVDPMCGSGTLLIEAALMAANIAPGSLRTRWGFQGWAQHDQELWRRVVGQAEEQRRPGVLSRLCLIGGDSDQRAVRIARENAERAGVADGVCIIVSDASKLFAKTARIGGPSIGLPRAGLLATNPPYGQRMGDRANLHETYASLRSVIDVLPADWSMAIITSDSAIDASLGEVATEALACYNGPIEACVRLYRDRADRTAVPIVSLSGQERVVPVCEPNSAQFAARLRKVAKQRTKWARKNGVACYRVYDVDLPDYSCAIDVFEGVPADDKASDAALRGRAAADALSPSLDAKMAGDTAARFVRVAEYQAPSSVDATRADRRFRDVLAVVPAMFDVDRGSVFSKVRKRAKGGGQYQDARCGSKVVYVQEGGYVFEVDLAGYLDTGLFLDHRPTRAMLAEMAHGKRFLNLFAYTGTASVYAAGGGAAQTTTVDMSRTYLAWAQRNMSLNGFAGSAHAFVRADVRTWLDQEAQRGATYDLVFCDPPTFSNSKRTEGRTFDVARDHVQLLEQVARVLAPQGTIVFSCNLRSFSIDAGQLQDRGFALRDISAQTIPCDFSRTPKIHHCYVLGMGT